MEANYKEGDLKLSLKGHLYFYTVNVVFFVASLFAYVHDLICIIKVLIVCG